MGKIKDFFSWSGPWLFWLFFVIILPGFFLIKDCSKREEREIERQRIEARWDSLKQAERIEQELQLKEYDEHINQFYSEFNKYYPVFSSPDDLKEWLLRANFAGFELLHELYSKNNDGFDGIDGFYRLQKFLFWGPPEYEVECETCGEITTYSEEEWP